MSVPVESIKVFVHTKTIGNYIRVANEENRFDLIESALQVEANRSEFAKENIWILKGVLLNAAENGKLPVVELLLQIEHLKAAAAEGNNIVLRAAAKKGHQSVVNRLLEIPHVKLASIQAELSASTVSAASTAVGSPEAEALRFSAVGEEGESLKELVKPVVAAVVPAESQKPPI